jgi:hypothetical protein
MRSQSAIAQQVPYRLEPQVFALEAPGRLRRRFSGQDEVLCLVFGAVEAPVIAFLADRGEPPPRELTPG